MNKKVLIIGLVVLIVGGYAGYSVAMPKKTPHMKVDGTIYVMPKSFTLNLNNGQYASLTVALLLAPGQSTGTGTGGATPPPDGYGGLPEEAIVRNIITNIITNQSGTALINATGRAKIQAQILKAIDTATDVKVRQVLFPDLAVQ
jgi:flagellar basal body-associated protein FliL